MIESIKYSENELPKEFLKMQQKKMRKSAFTFYSK